MSSLDELADSYIRSASALAEQIASVKIQYKAALAGGRNAEADKLYYYLCTLQAAHQECIETAEQLKHYYDKECKTMAFLKPDKIVTTTNGLTIKQKIIPDSLTATKNVASWCKKGQKMKPCAKLNNGTGKPKGITVHNTGDIKVAAGTNAAEQYTRATYNGNMSGVVVHFYVWENEIWQNLREDERGWHATDGSTRRRSLRNDGSTIGGNLDTIAIECIGNSKISEDTTAKLVAYLCKKYGLNPATDVYTHKYFYPSKDCPQYILPHWTAFLAAVQKYYTQIGAAKPTAPTPTYITHTVVHGDTLWNIAKKYLGKGSRYTEIMKFNGMKSPILHSGTVLKIPKECK